MRSTWTASEVGRDFERVDWTLTPLGPPDGWPQSLKTAVRILLSSKFAMWMAWGPELTFLCNDAYRRDTLGKKYPWALGRPASEVWSEIWDDIGPRIHTVMSTGASTWDESLQLLLERSGFIEESYHTFSYSPLAADDGRVEGMLCVVSEVTEQAISTRRMTTLRDLAARTTGRLTEDEAITAAAEQIEADPLSLPFGLVYVLDADGSRLVRAGTAGVDPDHPIACPVLEADSDAPWPVAEVLAGRQALVDLTGLPYDPPPGPWEEPPTHALVVPLTGAASPRPYGILVAGISRYRPLDEAYSGFVDLFAGQLAAAITAARTFEGEKRRAETLTRLDQAKTDFFTNVSHEFRTPLTLLLGPTSDALNDRSLGTDDVQRARFEIIHRNGQRLLQLVNSLLDFSRLEAGGIASHFEPVDLPQVTEPLVMMFESAAAQAGLTLTVELEPVPTTYVDLEHWSKIVLNLMSNAFKFTFVGGIVVSLREEDGHAALRVRDTGGGIPSDHLPHLFERFHRVHGTESRTHEGSGIGLALVAELARLHGGEVGVTSTEGVGTEMTVRIPLGRAHLPADEVVEDTRPRTVAVPASTELVTEAWRWLEPAIDASPGAQGPSDDSRARVLVVDDNADMRSYVAGLLTDLYEVVTAGDGLEALARVADSAFDLVVTDVMMPRLDGFGLLARLQDDPRTTSIPVIMLSARAGEEGTVEGLEAGAADYLVKPFAARELLARVRVNLELDRVRRIRATLERSEALLDQAQRLAKVGSWEVDLSTSSVTGSEELLRLLGRSRQDFEEMGYPSVISGVVHPDDTDRVNAVLAALQVGEVTAYDMRTVGPDGTERLVTVRAALLGDDDGKPHTLQGSMQDVTEQRAAERALSEVRARAEAAQREHSIAEELQRSLLPADSFDLDHLDVATYYRAGVEGTYVGGDWYDIIELPGGRTAFVMGDVMGRGVRAASVMGQLRSAVRAFATLDLPPDEVMRHLDGLVQDLPGDQIVTCVYGIFDPHDETLRYANAGHLPPLVASHRSDVRRLTAGGPPLGAGYGDAATEQVRLAAGATIVFYTDGLVEHRGQDIDEGIHALEREIDWRGRTPLAGMPEAIVDALLPDGPDDDVAILIARVSPSVEVVDLSLGRDTERPSVADARRFVTDRLHDWDVPETVTRDLTLITSELVTNAIVHGGAPVELRLERCGSRVVVEVQDDTAGELPGARLPADDDEHGRGLHIVEALSDEWGIRGTDRGKCVWSARAWTTAAGGGS